MKLVLDRPLLEVVSYSAPMTMSPGFYLTRAAWPHLKASSRGVVVNVAELNARPSFDVTSLSHTTNKAAILGMTRQLAMEGEHAWHRCCNSICPGLIESGADAAALVLGHGRFPAAAFPASSAAGATAVNGG